jgi:hypothetical protein
MAYDNYHKRHNIKVIPAGQRCLAVDLHRAGSPYKNIIGKVCQNADGTWDDGKTLKKHKRANGAIKTVVAHWRSWIGTYTQIDGSRRRRRKR